MYNILTGKRMVPNKHYSTVDVFFRFNSKAFYEERDPVNSMSTQQYYTLYHQKEHSEHKFELNSSTIDELGS